MNPSLPGSSFQIRNEQVRLSLLANQEDIPYADGAIPEETTQRDSNGNRAPVNKPQNYIESPPWSSPIQPPGSVPPRDSACCHWWGSVWNHFESVFLCLLFYIFLPFGLALFLVFGVFLRLGTKLIMSGSIPSPLTISRVFSSTGGNHSAVLLVLTGTCDIQKMRRCFMNVINTGKFYKLRKRVTKQLGYLSLDTSRQRFDIQNHVKYFDNRKNGVPCHLVEQSDVIRYLEEHYEQPFEGRGKLPQWEVLVIPAYNKVEGGYALLFRFHNGIMNWRMLRELIEEYLGRTSGRVADMFRANPSKKGVAYLWWKLRVFLGCFYYGPAHFLRKLFGGKLGSFSTLKKSSDGNMLTLGMSKPMSFSTWEDIQDRILVSDHTALATCVRISARNCLLGQALAFPRRLEVTRVLGGAEVDTFTVKYNKYRACMERLHATWHEVDNRSVELASQRLFNRIMILMASTFPMKWAEWLHGVILDGDVVVDFWPGVDEQIQLFGGDLVTDISAWSGIADCKSDFKITVTTYCGNVRANVVGKLGLLSESISGAQTMANELEEEYKQIAATVGVYENCLFMV